MEKQQNDIIFENTDKTEFPEKQKSNLFNIWQITTVVFLVLFLVSIFFNFFNASIVRKENNSQQDLSLKREAVDINVLRSKVFPANGVEIPIVWGDLGKRLIESGVIDANKLEELYARRGGLTDEEKQLLYGENNDKLRMDFDNSGFLLNLLWAFGLANKNKILEEGPMVDPRYDGDPSRFASTAGWTLAKGNAMDHYSKHAFVVLTPEQQQMVKRVSQGIFRPCCGNSAYFPDCNHGMAMLGLLELLAAAGVSEEDMYKIALQVNSYWFPTTYLTIAKYFAEKGIDWEKIDPKAVLGADFSSIQGYRQVLNQVQPFQQLGGSGCGV